MDNITTGSFIKQLRKEKDMTQEEMARRLGVTAPAVNKWESGASAPDIALLAPPYDKGLLPEALPLVAERMSPGGAILCESRVKEPLPEKVGAFCRKKSYRYGKIMLTLYRRPEEGEGEL